MRLKASYTVENSIIVPFVMMILVSLMLFAIYVSNIINIKAVAISSATKIEALNTVVTNDVIDNVKARAKNISLFTSNISVNVETIKSVDIFNVNDINGVKMKLETNFVNTPYFKWKGFIKEERQFNQYFQPYVVRKLYLAKDLVKGEQ